MDSGQTNNFYISGILPDVNYRFILASNINVARESGARHFASARITEFMAESMLGAFFLSMHSIKNDMQTISLHLEGQQPVSRLISFANSQGGMRSYAINPEAEWEGDVHEGIGAGMLQVNRWGAPNNKIYSSNMNLRAVPLSKSLEEFFGKSEQINAFIKIHNGIGYCFQALPGATADNTDAVLNITQENFLETFFNHENNENSIVRFNSSLKTTIMKTGSFHYYCDCNRDKIERMIIALGKDEAMSIIEEIGHLEVKCKFCQKKYTFNKDQVFSIVNQLNS